MGIWQFKVIKNPAKKFKKTPVKKTLIKRFSQNPFFYFGLMSFALLGLVFVSSDSLAKNNYPGNENIIFFNTFFKNTNNLENNDLFSSQHEARAPETPDLKIIQDNSISAVSTPAVLTTQTLGDIFGGFEQERSEIREVEVEIGDTVNSLANQYNVTPETVAWANNISKNTTLKVGQIITILPVSGIIYTVRNGDTLDQIAKQHSDKTHPVSIDDVVAYNSIANAQDIFIGDTLIIPGGIILPQAPPIKNIQVPLADNFFIHPAEGVITQGLHFKNGVDIANKAGTPIYAAASGVVQRAIFNGRYNLGMGNYITILHSNGTVTYYGHLQNVFVKSGDIVTTGDRIGLMGQTGRATGSHLHFGVIGAQNPEDRYPVGTRIQYKP